MAEPELTDFSSLINMDYPDQQVNITDEGGIEEIQDKSTQQEEIPQLTIDDRVAQLGNQLNEYNANNERIMTVLTTLIQRVMNPQQSRKPSEIDDEALQELGFEDPAKGRKFFNTLQHNITSKLDEQLAPVINQNNMSQAMNQLQLEFNATRDKYADFDTYIPYMTALSKEVPGLRPEDLYLKTKRLYPNVKPQQQQNTNQENNQQNQQNVRRFPPRIQSSNTSTQGNERKIKTIEDALNATYEELGIATG